LPSVVIDQASIGMERRGIQRFGAKRLWLGRMADILKSRCQVCHLDTQFALLINLKVFRKIRFRPAKSSLEN
jgi:hypothetical protein